MPRPSQTRMRACLGKLARTGSLSVGTSLLALTANAPKEMRWAFGILGASGSCTSSTKQPGSRVSSAAASHGDTTFLAPTAAIAWSSLAVRPRGETLCSSPAAPPKWWSNALCRPKALPTRLPKPAGLVLLAGLVPSVGLAGLALSAGLAPSAGLSAGRALSAGAAAVRPVPGGAAFAGISSARLCTRSSRAWRWRASSSTRAPKAWQWCCS
mmetsp:Transcript_53176/g.123804  ORF Transcript_53176/g.123804 Transcript_53176/m.123804 type:complete len:212 (+) Transcript_53176:234-869(+)